MCAGKTFAIFPGFVRREGWSRPRAVASGLTEDSLAGADGREIWRPSPSERPPRYPEADKAATAYPELTGGGVVQWSRLGNEWLVTMGSTGPGLSSASFAKIYREVSSRNY
jgi:hypothetical protein